MAAVILHRNESVDNQIGTYNFSIDGVLKTLRIQMRYLYYTKRWYLSVWDDEGTQLVSFVPFVTGGKQSIVDLLAQYGYLDIGSCAVLQFAQSETEEPTLESLGSSFDLVWGDRRE